MVLADDRERAHALSVDLTELGLRTLRVADGAAALRAVAEHSPAAIVLHDRLPGGSVVEWCRRIRAMSDAHLVVISNERREAALLRTLDAGADDHLVVGISAAELAARLRNAIARRADALPSITQPERSLGPLRIELSTRTATIEGRALDLTRNEFAVLEVLSRTPAQPVDRTTLLREGWGTTAADPHLVDVHLSNLRRKLSRTGAPLRVQTVRGLGLRLVVRSDDE